MGSQKRFTVQEVNQTIPFLERRLCRLQELMDELEESSPRRDMDSRLLGQEGGVLVPPRYMAGIQEIDQESQTLEEQGIILRDLRRGLVDFPAVLDGRSVFLCWVRGEERVSFFHETDGGFAGRKPLPGDAPE